MIKISITSVNHKATVCYSQKKNKKTSWSAFNSEIVWHITHLQFSWSVWFLSI